VVVCSPSLLHFFGLGDEAPENLNFSCLFFKLIGFILNFLEEMSQQPEILVTGGAGFIGSHTVVELLEADYKVIVVDNLINSKKDSLDRAEAITNKKIEAFYQIDICKREELEEVFQKHDFKAVIHFAGLKAVGESNLIPLRYYENNIHGTIVLLDLMQKYNIKSLIFSSSATVYGTQSSIETTEDRPTGATNPYGRTKLFVEYILQDVFQSAPKEWRIVILRYFNPVGAHPSGRIGEDPQGTPNNLMPYISQVAIGKRSHLNIFGNDYDTKDGTGVRDYIHVVDLAKGHIAALKKIEKDIGYFVYDLGTGQGTSVLELVEAMKKVSGQDIPVNFVERRTGDVAMLCASPKKAERELRWKAEFGIEKMCEDAWRWQINNPDGYK